MSTLKVSPGILDIATYVPGRATADSDDVIHPAGGPVLLFCRGADCSRLPGVWLHLLIDINPDP